LGLLDVGEALARRSPDSAFLMTPEQYLAQAESLRATGHEYLAQQYECLYRMRTRKAPEQTPESPSPSIVPER
jgi:hypothetical protein